MAGVRQFNEGAVLTKSLGIFWDKGYQGTSMIDLAKGTGVQRGSLYNAYGKKSVLFTAAFEHYADRLIADIESTLADSDSKTALLNMFEFFTTRLCGDAESRGCLTTKTIMEAKAADSIVLEQMQKVMNRLEKTIQARLETAKGDRQFLGDPQKIARYLVALSRGLAVIERVYSDESRIRETYCIAIEMLPFNEN